MIKKKENSRAVLKELSSLLEECKIDEWAIDTKNKKLTIYYKEDFDRFYPRLNAEPTISDPHGYGAPYGAGHWAFFITRDGKLKGT